MIKFGIREDEKPNKRGLYIVHQTGRGTRRERKVYAPGMKAAERVKDLDRVVSRVFEKTRAEIEDAKASRAKVKEIRQKVSDAAEEFPDSKLKVKVSKDGKVALQRREGGKFQKSIPVT